MDIHILLGVGITTLIIGAIAAVYTKLLKKRMRRFVLRYERIQKHFNRKEGRG